MGLVDYSLVEFDLVVHVCLGLVTAKLSLVFFGQFVLIGLVEYSLVGFGFVWFL